jgi:hypothetical protein
VERRALRRKTKAAQRAACRALRTQDYGKEESELIDAALEKASAATAIAEAEVAKALGYELCKCQFPPSPVGFFTMPAGIHKATEPVFECPKCGINSAAPFEYQRTKPERRVVTAI